MDEQAMRSFAVVGAAYFVLQQVLPILKLTQLPLRFGKFSFKRCFVLRVVLTLLWRMPEMGRKKFLLSKTEIRGCFKRCCLKYLQIVYNYRLR